VGVRGQSYKCAQEKALRTKARRPSALTKCFSVTIVWLLSSTRKSRGNSVLNLGMDISASENIDQGIKAEQNPTPGLQSWQENAQVCDSGRFAPGRQVVRP